MKQWLWKRLEVTNIFCNFYSPVGKWTENCPSKTSLLVMEDITLVFHTSIARRLDHHSPNAWGWKSSSAVRCWWSQLMASRGSSSDPFQHDMQRDSLKGALFITSIHLLSLCALAILAPPKGTVMLSSSTPIDESTCASWAASHLWTTLDPIYAPIGAMSVWFLSRDMSFSPHITQASPQRSAPTGCLQYLSSYSSFSASISQLVSSVCWRKFFWRKVFWSQPWSFHIINITPFKKQLSLLVLVWKTGEPWDSKSRCHGCIWTKEGIATADQLSWSDHIHSTQVSWPPKQHGNTLGALL